LRELSLHILDLLENAVRAGATLVAVSIEEEPQWDVMSIVVEDNGRGLSVPAETATDPFYTTKQGRRTGLGLALFRFRIEQAQGELCLARSPLGGTAVRATVRLSHVDRSPLGELAATLSGFLAANRELELSLHLRVASHERVLSSGALARELAGELARKLARAGAGAPPGASAGARETLRESPAPSRLAVARLFNERIKESLSALDFKE
jgi:hypothetical protein